MCCTYDPLFNIHYSLFVIQYLCRIKNDVFVVLINGFLHTTLYQKKCAQCAICCYGILPEIGIVKDAWNEQKI